MEITDTKETIFDLDKKDVKGLLKYVKFKLIDDFIALDLFKNWKYSAFVIFMCLLDPVALHTIYTYLPDFIIHVGYSSDISWISLTVLGITNTVARLTMGVSNKSVSTITVIFGLGALLNGFSVLFMPFISDHFWLICLSSGTFGFGKGAFWSLRAPVLMEIVASEDFDRALGTTEFFTGFLMLTCPLQGKLYDITGEYTWTFVMSGTMATLG